MHWASLEIWGGGKSHQGQENTFRPGLAYLPPLLPHGLLSLPPVLLSGFWGTASINAELS